MSKQIPDPYYQRIRSAVTGQVVGVSLPTLFLSRSFAVVAGKLIEAAIAFTLAAPTAVAVQDGPNESPVMTRTVTITVGVAVQESESFVATPGSEPVIDGPNESPALGVLVEVAVV